MIITHAIYHLTISLVGLEEPFEADNQQLGNRQSPGENRNPKIPPLGANAL
jgi:hypothetical protein